MTAHTPDALASALPAGIKYSGQGVSWNTREVAAFQAEAGYVLVHIAPDEATVERLADVIHARMCGCPYGATTSAYRAARETLAALAGTSAQARHTADGTTGGGEHG